MSKSQDNAGGFVVLVVLFILWYFRSYVLGIVVVLGILALGAVWQQQAAEKEARQKELARFEHELALAEQERRRWLSFHDPAYVHELLETELELPANVVDQLTSGAFSVETFVDVRLLKASDFVRAGLAVVPARKVIARIDEIDFDEPPRAPASPKIATPPRADSPARSSPARNGSPAAAAASPSRSKSPARSKKN